MKTDDVVALSVYPYMNPTMRSALSAWFAGCRRSVEGQAIAVTESGYETRSIKFWCCVACSEEAQYAWLEYLFAQAQSTISVRVIGAQLFEDWYKLPVSMQELSTVWAYSGLQTSDEKAKKALSLWISGWEWDVNACLAGSNFLNLHSGA